MADPSIRTEEVCHLCKGERKIEGRACPACGATGTRQLSMPLKDLAERVASLLKQRD